MRRTHRAMNLSPTSLSTRSWFNTSLLVFMATLLLSVAGYVYSAVASRTLSVADYGTLYALISLYTVGIVPSVVFSPVIARLVAEVGAAGDENRVTALISAVARAFFIFSVLYAVLVIVAQGPLSSYLGVARPEIIFVAIMCGVAIFSAATRAISQGLHAYNTYSASVIGEGLFRVGTLVAFAITGLTVIRGAGAFLTGLTAGAIVVTLPLAKRLTRGGPFSFDWRRVAQTSFGAASLAIAMSFMGFADVVLVRHYFSPTESGLYSAVSLCAKIMLYFVSFVPAVLIPRATHHHTRGETTRHTLWSSVGFVALVSIIGLGAYALEGKTIMHVVVGMRYDQALPLLLPYAGAMTLLALTNTLGSYGLATHRLSFVVPLTISTALTICVIAVVHPALLIVSQELLVGNFLMLLCTGVPLLLQSVRHRST